ncbi:hypothetical protein U9M48_031026 [Paspalum notatum var. saurae]|uniref:WAT1-related protein n=1 Tax=Paspalum notatum var. saurae TaxID=547442 RepID=A0AAQ3U4X0_PASNO
MMLYKGSLMQLAWNRHASSPVHGAEAPAEAATAAVGGREWFIGSVFIIIATLAWASLFILQTHTIKQYSAQLSLTTLVCFIGTLQAIVVTCFDMNLLAAAYAVS